VASQPLVPSQKNNKEKERGCILRGRIPSLDGLRAVSILLVLYGHAVGTAGFPVTKRSFGLAEAGVRIFFIISGFLITLLLLKELDSTGRISLKGFYRRRILRIFPAFYAYWTVILVLVLAGSLAIPPRDFVYAATYTINYVIERPWHLGHLWSLAVEEQFYALWPLTIFLLGRRRAFWAAGTVVLMVPFIRLAQFRFWPSHRLGITEEFHTIADCIATGCVLAGLQGWLWSYDRYRRFIGSWQFWLAPLAAMVAVVAGLHPRVKWLVGIPIFNISVALCIDRWTRLSDADPIAKALNWRPLAFLGVLSYSLYLWQQPFMDRSGHHPWNRFPLNVALAFLLALVSYYLIEKPFLSLRYTSTTTSARMGENAPLTIPGDGPKA
jgi:peptidoglycan/LPS O-acetylase OafA/YrhL